MRGEGPAENMSETGQANTHSVPGLVSGRLAPRLRRREHLALGATLTRSYGFGSRDPRGEDLHTPHIPCAVSSIWPLVRERVVSGGFTPPSFQSPNLIWRLRSMGARFS